MSRPDLSDAEREVVAHLVKENITGYIRARGGNLSAADRRSFARVLLHSSLMYDTASRRRLNRLRAKLLRVPEEECQ